MEKFNYQAAISELTKLVYLDVKHLASKGVGKMKDVMEVGVKGYLTRESERFSKSKTFLHRSAPVDFYRVFEAPIISARSKNVQLATLSPKALMASCPKITITGEAGSGKSTLLKHFFLYSIANVQCIPIFLELRSLNGTDSTIAEYIENLIGYNNVGAGKGSLDSLFEKGRLLLFLDGIDELDHEKRSPILNEINEISVRFPKIAMFASSRPHDSVEFLPHFFNYIIKPFDQDKVISFIRRQGLHKDLETKLLGLIEQTFASDFRGFLSNPLLLSLYILTFNSNASLPKRKSTFYRRVFDTLFAEHDSLSKLGYERPKRSGLSQEQFEHILERFSQPSHRKA